MYFKVTSFSAYVIPVERRELYLGFCLFFALNLVYNLTSFLPSAPLMSWHYHKICSYLHHLYLRLHSLQCLMARQVVVKGNYVQCASDVLIGICGVAPHLGAQCGVSGLLLFVSLIASNNTCRRQQQQQWW